MADDLNYVYVMAAIENRVPVAPCKIGITRSLQSRLSSVQTGNPKKLVVVSAVLIPHRQLAELIEGMLHECFEEFRLAGEWFNLSPIDATIGCCTMVRDAFHELGMEDGDARECLNNLGITHTITKCFEYIKICKANGTPLETRF
jgi:hypothetical protein